MPTVAERLKAEREALGLSQQALAELCNVSARSQRNYESGERSPDAEYLGALAAAGADVLYVLTGARGSRAHPAPPVSPRVRALVDNYLAAPEEGKRVIEGTATLASKAAKKAKTA